MAFPFSRLGVSLVISVIFSGAMLVRGADEKPEAPPKPPELKVFEPLVGSFNTTTVVKPAVWTPQEIKLTGTLTREWILDGRFLQEKAKQSDGVEAVVTFSYDPQRSIYRMWHFSSTGLMSETRGTWDEGKQTLTMQEELPEGMTTRATLRIIDKDNHEWAATVKDKDGKVYWEGGGRCTRRK